MAVYYKLFFLLFTLIFNAAITLTQDTNIVKYFPLKIGNKWVYAGSYFSIQCISSFRIMSKVDSSITANGKTYFRINVLTKIITGNNCSYSFLGNASYRVDSINGNIYQLISNPNCSFSPNERIVDSLKSRLSDTLRVCGQQSDPMKILRDTNLIQLFALQKQTKMFEGGNFFEYSTFNTYAKDFGIASYRQGGMSLSSQANLIGCVINGVLYGDTNFYLVSLNTISSEAPEYYNLNQNYPNPFNPTTQIKFDIPKLSVVNLIVYDALGRQISELVKEQLNQGSYLFEWNAEAYPSGIYFYKLITGEFSGTRKMILIK